LLAILYQDDEIVVVHKPSGLLVHRSAIDKRETEFLIQQLRDQIGRHVFPVHRLDKPTSGIMVLALNKQSARALSSCFAERAVHKEYTAILRGYATSQVINYALKEQYDKMTDNKSVQHKEAQDASSEVVVLAQAEINRPLGRYNTARYTAVRLIPKTGRKHQLRRHMSHIRHPIIGDTCHGDGKQNQFARTHLLISRLSLVATKLIIAHPTTSQSMTFTTTIDADLRAAFSIFDQSLIANE
jgi:tRNA pseudouridine65 synthase